MKYKHSLFILISFVVEGVYCQNALDNYIVTAINNSPLVKTKYKDLLSKQEEVKSKVLLDNPELSVSLLPKPMMNVNSEQVASVSLMQMFPWFGTLSSNEKMLLCSNQSAYWSYVSAANQVAYNVKALYYDMTLINCQRKILEKQKQLLEQTKEAITVDYYSKNKVVATNLNDIQIKEDELELEILTLKMNLDTKKQQFANLLHTNSQDEVVLPDTIICKYDLTGVWVFDSIISNNPELKAIQQNNSSLYHATQMQKRMSYPMIGLGLEWMINKKTDMPKMESMNGKDMLAIMVKVSMPIYRKKYSSAISSINYKSQSLEQDYLYKVERLRDDFLSICNDITIETKKIALYQKQEQLTKENILLKQNTYSTTDNSIRDILDLQTKIFDYQLKTLVSQAKLNTLVAKLEMLQATNYNNILKSIDEL